MSDSVIKTIILALTAIVVIGLATRSPEEVAEVPTCRSNGIEVNVSRVIDGDTFEYVCEDQEYKVRIIGIDTPETVHPAKPVQCYGQEASDRLKSLLLNHKVVLLTGMGTMEEDVYGRLLRYVTLSGVDIGTSMIKDGYAFSYKKFPHEKLAEYNMYEQTAREEGKGLWSKKCEYAAEGDSSGSLSDS